jgi:rfaE bifunctional protein nucleotidyltransferase chain/domain
MNAKIVPDYRDLAAHLDREREAGRRVALANGCFDILHVGHVRLIADACREADVLVVALNDDESVRRNKGPERPAVPVEERMELMSALRGVSYVTSFGETTADAIIDVLRPDILIKGKDRDPHDIPESDTLAAYGARVVICGDPKTHSSTELLQRSRK